MKRITKVMLPTFGGAAVATGITAGTAIPILSNQNNMVKTQTATSTTDNDGVKSQNPNTDGTNNNQNKTSVIIKSYSAAESKQFFEAANSKGETKNAIHKLAKDLSEDANSSNYFANFYDPIIPQELSDNKVTVTPQSFELKDDNTVVYNYNLESQTFSIPAKAVVSGFYQWPTVVREDFIDANWKPKNLDFIKANLGANPDRKTFDRFIVDHWNESLLNDTIQAFRYYYQMNQYKTNILKIYFHSNLTTSLAQSTIDKITPEYNSLSGDYKEVTRPEIDGNYFLVFVWQLSNNQKINSKESFSIQGQLKLTFNKNTKPVIIRSEQLKNIATAKNKGAEETDIVKLTLASAEANILWEDSLVNNLKVTHWDEDNNAKLGNLKINILDALYEYISLNNPASSRKNLLAYFDWFAYALSKKAKTKNFPLDVASSWPKF